MKNWIAFVIVLVAVAAVAGSLVYFSAKSKKEDQTTSDNASAGQVAGTSTQQDNKSSQYIEKLAKYTKEKGMVMYGAYWCSHCKQQKETFGDAFQYIDYVECDAKGQNANPDECKAQGIEGYPTWIYSGTKYSGYKTLAELAEIVGFPEQ